MAFDLSFEEQQVLAETLERTRARLSRRELAAAVLGGVAFAGAVAGLVLARTPGPTQLEPALLSVLVLLAASRVQLDTPLAREATLSSQFRETWVYVVDAALSGMALVVGEAIRVHPAAPLGLLPLLGLVAALASERRRRLQSLLELNNAYRGTALALGDVVEADDGYTGQHCKSVVGLAVAVGEKMGLSAEQLRNLEFGALLRARPSWSLPSKYGRFAWAMTPQVRGAGR